MIEPPAINFVLEKTKCIHRVTALDIPPGHDAYDVTISCKEDPFCPEKTKTK